MNVLALDFGGSSVKYGIVDENAVISESGKLPAPLSSKEEFVDMVKNLYEKYKDTVEGISISIPGNVDPESGMLFENGVYQKLYGNSIIELVKEKCMVPVAVENDGKCGALSEAWKGALKDCRDGAVIILGSGIAGGLIKDHRIHSGKNFNAGEFSFQVINPGEYSMLTTAFMSVGMLGVTYKLCKMKNLDFSVQDSSPSMDLFDSLFASKYPKHTGEPLKIKADGKQFFRWVEEGDEDARKIYREFIVALGALVVNTQICYAPEKIVIGGGLSANEHIIKDVQAEIEKYYSGIGLGEKMKAEVVRSSYLGESNLFGAAYNYLIRNGGMAKTGENAGTELSTDVYPYRAPKKYPKKDLHGRVRMMMMYYNHFDSFQKFYVNVFGWDMFELPEAAGGQKKGSETPSLLIATGPSYETWEGLNPGHMNVMAYHSDGELKPPFPSLEVHMDVPFSETISEVEKYGGRLIGKMPEENDNWMVSANVYDPSGNILSLGKCPSSRTWEEPEAGYDKD